MINLTKQRGAAIIIALFVVALVAAIATIMIERLRTDIRRTELILNANTAYLYAQGSVAWAIDQLNTNWKQQQPNKIVDKTPIRAAQNKKQGYVIDSVIYDAQSYFNLNNLTDPLYQPYFTRLIQTVAPTIEAAQAQNITLAVVNWISGGNNPALDEYYLKSSPSYRAPHRPMVSLSELRLVKDVSPALFNKLSPLIFALPKTTPLSINNADASVIMTLSPNMSLDSAKGVQNKCKAVPFQTIEEVNNFSIFKNNPIDSSKITVISNYFLVEVDVTLGSQHSVVYTLLERVAQGAQSVTNILWQSKGTL